MITKIEIVGEDLTFFFGTNDPWPLKDLLDGPFRSSLEAIEEVIIDTNRLHKSEVR